jgi:hypothetical protein
MMRICGVHSHVGDIMSKAFRQHEILDLHIEISVFFCNVFVHHLKSSLRFWCCAELLAP